MPIFKQGALTDTIEHRQQALQGFAVAVLGIGPMIEAILSRHTTIAGLDIEFLDIDSLPGEQFLYSHKPRITGTDHAYVVDNSQSTYQTEQTMQFADRQWKIIAKSANSELYPEWSSSNLQLPVAIFILSAILAFYLRRAGLKEIERNEMLAYHTALLDAIPNPIFVFDEQLKFSSCNKAYEQFFNMRREDYINRPFSNLDYYTDPTKQAFLLAQARHATSRNSGTPVALIRSPTQRMGDALNALRP